MEPDEQQIKEMVVASIGKCAACGAAYGVDNITVLGHQDDLWFLMVACKDCSSHALIAALLKRDEKVLPPAAATESGEETSAEPVSRKDVIDIKRFLEGFDGDFAKLFQNGSDDSARDADS